MAFICLLVYIFVIYIRPAEWIEPVLFWPLVDICIGFTVFFLLLEKTRDQTWRLKTIHNLLLIGFLGCVVMSHLSNLYMQATWDSFIAFGKVCIPYILIVNIVNTEKRFKHAIWWIIVLTVVLAIQGIDQKNSGMGWAMNEMVGREGRITWIGIFNDPNDLALGLVTAIGLTLPMIFDKSALLMKLFCIGLNIPLFTAMYYTNSRGGMLAVGATLIYYFLRRMKNKFWGLTLGALAMFLVFILGPARMSNISVDEASAYGRIDAWYEGIQMFKYRPVFGVGYGMFRDYHHQVAHNSYVHVLAEEGAIGLLLWMALIYMSFKGLWQLSIKDPSKKRYYSGLEAGLFGFMSAAYFLSRAYVPNLYIMLGLAAALACTYLEPEDYRLDGKEFRRISYLTISMMLLMFLSMRISLRLM